MPKFDALKPELIWPGKYDTEGNRVIDRGVALPFQVVETIREGRASREKGYIRDLFSAKPSTGEEWRNKLIWGDNLLVMSSLMEELAGKIDLIYIDPPFATGADFSFKALVGDGDLEIAKSNSAIEEKAYRDTWGAGLQSYLAMISNRLSLMRDLLKQNGSIFIHIDDRIGPYVRIILDEIFGQENFVNSITWKRSDAHSDIGQGAKHLGKVCDTIFYYSRNPKSQLVNMQFTPLPESTVKKWYRHVEEGTGRLYNKADITGPGGAAKGNPVYEWNGITRAWRFGKDKMNDLDAKGLLAYSSSGQVYLKRYLDESKGVPLQDLWDDIKMIRGIHANSEGLGYATQKPESLLERIIKLASNEEDLIADLFLGSGTTVAVAERLNRRWIGCDLGRFAIHTTRKRLLGIPDCKPFEILNLGRYERKHWQGVTFGDEKPTDPNQAAIAEYVRFILDLYHAQPLPGTHIHGRKGGALVHVGAVDAPVTISQIGKALAETEALGQKELHVLGWEWEMGLHDPMVQQARQTHGVRLRLLNIPREVMERQAVDRGDVRFFDLAYLQAEVIAVAPAQGGTTRDSRRVKVRLTDFAIPDTDLIPEEVRGKIQKWSDYIDYWAVDWDFQHDTFMNQWQAYRTRKVRKLDLESAEHSYPKPGHYQVLVKVVDIFGNDTSRLLTWDAR